MFFFSAVTMLKAELILPRLKKHEEEIIPLILPADYDYLKVAGELIHLVKIHLGRSRGELEEAVKIYEGDRLDYHIIRGLFNVLENRCIFSRDGSPNPIELRKILFSQGPITFKPNPSTRAQIVAETAAQYKLSPQAFETSLFADLMEERIILSSGDPLTPIDLINRYNLEVARGLLYWAREVRITVYDTYKDLFKYIKLFKLMHTLYPNQPTGYQIILHGPISPLVKSTIRYGLQFAKFLPALLLGRHWRLEAEIQLPGTSRPRRYLLDEKTSLATHFKAAKLFDSELEADFAREFETKYQGAKRRWQLTREDEVIVVGDTVIIPDFALTHQDGRRALIEIIGFWHPHYLHRKLKKIHQAGRRDLILLVYESANVAPGVFETVAAGEVLTFTNKPILKQVLAAAERCALSPPWPGRSLREP